MVLVWGNLDEENDEVGVEKLKRKTKRRMIKKWKWRFFFSTSSAAIDEVKLGVYLVVL